MAKLNPFKLDDRLLAYYEDLKAETGIDRASLIRLALYAAPFADAFAQKIREKKSNPDYTLPNPVWGLVDDNMWKQAECTKDLLGPNDTHQSYIETAAAPEIAQAPIVNEVVEVVVIERQSPQLIPALGTDSIVIRCGSSTLVIG